MMRLISQFIHRHHHINWALADQAVVSGSSFITGVLLARFLGPETFGLFVLLQSVMLYVNSFQGALIFQPMMSAAPQLPEHERRPYLQGVFALQLILTFGLVAITVLLAMFADALFAFEGLQPSIILSLAAAMLAFQLQDWQRRYFFVEENARSVFFNDIIAYGGQTLLLVLACYNQRLDVASAFWIIAATAFIGFITGFGSDRLTPVFAHARSALREGWQAGRDYLAAWQFQLLGNQGVFMIGAGVVGTQAVGGVRATQNIVGPINILFQVMENLVPIAAAKRYSKDGLPGLIHFLWRITLLGTLFLVPLLLLLSLFAHALVQTLYGAQYLAFASLVYWQAMYVFIQFYQRQTFFFLRTVKATGVVLRTGMLMGISSLLVAALTVHQLQETGLMLSLVSGASIAFLYSLVAARNIARQLAQNGAPDSQSTLSLTRRKVSA